MASLVLGVALLLLMTLRTTLGCFPIDSLFRDRTSWSQDIRKPWRRLYEIGTMADNIITMETQSPKMTRMATVTCMQRFEGHRYKISVEEDNKPKRYGCVRFKLLSYQVIRKLKTKLQKNELKVNCETDEYKEDLAVMIANNKMNAEACPLLGGYQMLLHQGATVSGHCLDTVQTYNPRLEFSCDGNYVLADFGQACGPVLPTKGKQTNQIPFAYFQCVGSWDEPRNVKAVLLQLKRDPSTFWCMHYKPREGSSGDKMLSIYMSFDGKCSGQVFKNDWNPMDSNGMFGTLAQYVPVTDKRCFESSYIDKCRFNEASCFDSESCPLDCHRCNKKVPKRDCGFTDIVGQWSTVDTSHGVTVDIKPQGLKVTEYGIFSCYDDGESGQEGYVYPLIRSNPYSSCLPLYACAKLHSPAPGVLNFFLRPAEREDTTGRPLSCARNPEGMGTIVPATNGNEITIISPEKVERVPCRIPKDLFFPSTMGDCLFSLKQCAGECDTVRGDFDKDSCGNDTIFDLDHQHVCHARLELMDGVRALITSSVSNEIFLCWVITPSRLFITVPEYCNTDGVLRILRDENADTLYDPFLGISLPQDSRATGHGGNGTLRPVPGVLTIMPLILLLILTMLKKE